MNIRELFYSSDTHNLISFSANSPNWLEIIEKRKNYPVDRKLLYQKLSQQNSLQQNETVKINLDKLKHENTFTITTGHQLCFGTGPLYVIYKTLSVIELCKSLNQKFPDYHFIPIFWLASEDHDFLEVNHFYLDYQTKIEYTGNFQGAVGRHRIDKSLINFSSWVTEPYLFYDTWKQAFQALLHFIFFNEGLLFIDGDDPDFKRSFIPFLRTELQEKKTYHNVIKTNNELIKLNLKIQWKVSDINLFYLTDTHREKIQYKNNEYFIGYQKVDITWLINMLNQYPNRFSPNAGFRPLYQEFLLPNLAYVGGWGEILYWLQLKDNFQDYGVFYPLLLPRFSYTFYEDTTIEKIKQLGYPPEFLLKNYKEIQRTIALKYFDFENLKNDFFRVHQNISHIQQQLEKYSETLVYSLECQKFYWNKIYHQLENRLIKLIQNQYPKEFYQIYRLKDHVQPDGFIQERTLNISSFVNNRDDLTTFIDKIRKAIQNWLSDLVAI